MESKTKGYGHPNGQLDGVHKEWRGLRNLTPHPINFAPPHPEALPQFTLLPWGDPLRLPETYLGASFVGDGACEVRTVAHDLGVLPEPEPGVVWVVSLPVLMALSAVGVEREDFVAPDTGGGAVRDNSGNIIGTTNFIRLGRLGGFTARTKPSEHDLFESGVAGA